MMKNWKGFGRKQLWPNFKVISRYSPGGTEENHACHTQFIITLPAGNRRPTVNMFAGDHCKTVALLPNAHL
jgi:hypothetical protein